MRKRSFSALAWLALLVAFSLLAGSGCTRRFFRQRADKEVDALLREKDVYDPWKIDQYHVEPDPRARFSSSGNPDRPPMPPDDSAATSLAPNPQRPPKTGIELEEGQVYLDLLADWDQENRTADTTTPPPPKPLANDPFVSRSQPKAFRLKLEQAVELGLINSREFQDRREDLYLTALPVTVERFAFSTQFFATEELIRERLGKLFPDGPANRWVSNSNLGFSKLFPRGALLLFQFANRTVIEMANKASPHTVSESTINLDFIQPLLRGGGKAVTLEPLTQAERDLLYEIRDFARFRKQFFVAIAAGADIGGTAIGATRFRNQPAAFSINDFVPGALIRPRRGSLQGLPASGFAQSSGYLPVVLGQVLMDNERQNITKLEEILKLFKAFEEGGEISPLQVDRVEQQLLQSRSSAYFREQDYRDDLDRFKLQLGVPVNLPLELDDTPVATQRSQLRHFERILQEYDQVREEAASLYFDPQPDALRKGLLRLGTSSKLAVGTDFRMRFVRRWNFWTGRSTMELRQDISRMREQLRRLLDERDQLEQKGQILSPEQQRTLDDLRFDLDIARFELNLRAYEALPVARLAGLVGQAAMGNTFVPLGGLMPLGTEVRGPQATRFLEVYNDFEVLLLEARNERIAGARKEWTALPRLCLERQDLMTADLDLAEALVARAALDNRFDLMNTRAQLMDSWRQIAVAANALLGTANVEYHLTSLTPPGQAKPFAFDGSRSRHQLAFNAELPLVRIVERNSYRASLIGWQRQRRTLMATEDTIVAGARAQLRQLRVLAENYRIQQRAVELAYLQVENSLDTFRAPPLPTNQPLAGGAAGSSAALTQQLLEAQRNLIDAQNRLVTVWVQYLTTRMQLYRDLELMPLDYRGAWTDDVATCYCPPNLPGPAGVDPSQGSGEKPEAAPAPRPLESPRSPVNDPAGPPPGGRRLRGRLEVYPLRDEGTSGTHHLPSGTRGSDPDRDGGR